MESVDSYSYTLKRTARGMWRCLNSTYFWACLVYLIQCTLVVETNMNAPDLDARSIVGNNHILLRLARVFISLMFIMTWKDGKHWLDSVILADYIDLFASVWMLLAAGMYSNVRNSDTIDGILVVRRIEVAAWLLEIVASFGWLYSWYITYYEEFGSKPEPTPNRGWTLDDPDIIANFTNFAIAFTFFLYSYSLLLTPDASDIHDFSDLHNVGDKLLLFNAWIYLVVSMRDCDVFWFMPHWGTILSIEEIRTGDHTLLEVPVIPFLRTQLSQRIHAPETVGGDGADDIDGEHSKGEAVPLLSDSLSSP